MKALFPYMTLIGEVRIDIDDIRVDGRPLPTIFLDSARNEIALAALEGATWTSATIHLTVAGPAGELLNEDAPWSEIRAFALLHCGASNGRLSVELEEDAPGTSRWSGRLELERQDWFGRGTLGAELVARVQGVDHRIIGSTSWPGSSPWTVSFDDLPPSPVHGSISVRWVNFADPAREEDAYLKEFAQDPTFLSLDEKNPDLMLNSAFPGLPTLLDDRPRRPAAERALHNVTRGDIAARAWQALFMAALDHVEADEETGVPEWPAPDWMRPVLESLLARMYPDRGREDALMEVVAAQRTPGGASELQERLVTAAAAQARFPKLLRDGIVQLAGSEG